MYRNYNFFFIVRILFFDSGFNLIEVKKIVGIVNNVIINILESNNKLYYRNVLSLKKKGISFNCVV